MITITAEDFFDDIIATYEDEIEVATRIAHHICDSREEMPPGLRDYAIDHQKAGEYPDRRCLAQRTGSARAGY
jgi:hypothetical protein